jgi:hypothetical protein
MTTLTHAPPTHGAQQPRGQRPWCTACDTDLHLVVDSITVLDDWEDTLNVALNCEECGGHRVLYTTPRFVAAILARSTTDDDVVHLGAQYIHCGEPMPPHDPTLRSSRTPVSTDMPAGDFLEAYLRARVLRCRCGFQIEVPRTFPTVHAIRPKTDDRSPGGPADEGPP